MIQPDAVDLLLRWGADETVATSQFRETPEDLIPGAALCASARSERLRRVSETYW